MTNYNLAEFEKWCEENNIPTTPFNWKDTIRHYQNKPQDFIEVVKKAISNPATVSHQFAHFIAQWKRERERERESRMRREGITW